MGGRKENNKKLEREKVKSKWGALIPLFAAIIGAIVFVVLQYLFFPYYHRVVIESSWCMEGRGNNIVTGEEEFFVNPTGDRVIVLMNYVSAWYLVKNIGRSLCDNIELRIYADHVDFKTYVSQNVKSNVIKKNINGRRYIIWSIEDLPQWSGAVLLMRWTFSSEEEFSPREVPRLISIVAQSSQKPDFTEINRIGSVPREKLWDEEWELTGENIGTTDIEEWRYRYPGEPWPF